MAVAAADRTSGVRGHPRIQVQAGNFVPLASLAAAERCENDEGTTILIATLIQRSAYKCYGWDHPVHMTDSPSKFQDMALCATYRSHFRMQEYTAIGLRDELKRSMKNSLRAWPIGATAKLVV